MRVGGYEENFGRVMGDFLGHTKRKHIVARSSTDKCNKKYGIRSCSRLALSDLFVRFFLCQCCIELKYYKVKYERSCHPAFLTIFCKFSKL